MNEKIFTNGMIVKQRENAPDFVIGSLAIKPVEFIQWMRDNIEKGSEWINIDLLIGKSGKPYSCLNTFKPNQGQQSPNNAPQQQQSPSQGNKQDAFQDDIPF